MSVPAQLLTAIDNAAAAYGVNPNWLVRIWQIESGTTFPNPAVNSIGCGGLFGLCQGSSNVDPATGATINLLSTATTQAQANAAAYTLSRLLHQFGNIYQAMIAYSGGSTNEASFVAGAPASGTIAPTTVGPSTSSSTGTIATGTPIVGGVISGIGDLLGKLSASSILGQIGPIIKAYFTAGLFLDPLFVGMGLLFVLIGALGMVLGHGDAGQTIKYVGKKAATAAILA